MKIAALLAILMLPLCLQAEDSKSPQVLGGVVRSEKWTIRRNVGEEEFEGNVSYKNEWYEMKGDWALYKKLKGIFTVVGHSYGKKIEETGATTESYSHKAEYFQNEGTAWLYQKSTEPVHIIRIDEKKERWDTFSKSAFLDEKKERVELYGNVKIVGDKSQSLSDKAVYNKKTSVIDLYGRPLMTGVQNDHEYAVVGDTATVADMYQDILVKKHVIGWIRSVNKGSLEDGTKKRKP